MNASDLQPFFDWAAAKKSRSLDIKTRYQNAHEVEVWVYDYEFDCGQYVTSVAEIDLERRCAEALERNAARLRHIMEATKAKGAA